MIEGYQAQTLAIAAATSPGSVELGMKPDPLLSIPSEEHAASICFLHETIRLQSAPTNLIYLLPAFENASAFAKEDEPLSDSSDV